MGSENRFRFTPRVARINANMKQKDAAVQLGISECGLRRYENGKSPLPFSIAKKMAALYFIPLELLKEVSEK